MRASVEGMETISVNQSGYVVLPKISDPPDGELSVLEAGRDIPFGVKRVYYINKLDNCISIRGKHAHRELEQVIFCLNGSFLLSLDDGCQKQDILMRRDNIGVYLGKMLWHTMHDFSSGCVIMVVASDHYNEADYIRDYDCFLELVKGQ